MNLYLLMARHGYALTFGLLVAEAIGLPFPAAIALVAAGAAVAAHALWGPYILLAAIVALLLGDTVQFWLGRYMGWLLLGFLCRVSINPETCILRSAESFYKRGKATLVVAKFIPGVNTMAAPLAGSMKMRFWQFLQLDFAGALVYSLTYLSVGYLSRDFLAAHPARVSRGWAGNGSGRGCRCRGVRDLPCRSVLQAQNVSRGAADSGAGAGRAPGLTRLRIECLLSTSAATAITTRGRRGSKARSASSPTTLKRKSRTFPRTRTFIFTALERAKRPAPGWRICCGKKDSTRS